MKVVAIDPITKNVFNIARRVAKERKPVVLIGETGTGKTFLANYIHKLGEFNQEPFLSVRLTDFPETLIESEVFGVEEGVATGVSKKGGIFESVGFGTLCISGVEDIPPKLQAVLLRILESQEFERIGGKKKIRFSGRLIFEFQQEPEDLIKEKRLREDLYYRINFFEIFIPPIRERKREIIPFLKEFLKREMKRGSLPQFSDDFGRILLNYDWKGNAREIQNLAFYLASSGKEVFDVEDLPPSFFVSPFNPIDDGLKNRLTLRELTQSYIRAVVSAVGGNKTEASKWLKISRKNLWERLKLK